MTTLSSAREWNDAHEFNCMMNDHCAELHDRYGFVPELQLKIICRPGCDDIIHECVGSATPSYWFVHAKETLSRNWMEEMTIGFYDKLETAVTVKFRLEQALAEQFLKVEPEDVRLQLEQHPSYGKRYCRIEANVQLSVEELEGLLSRLPVADTVEDDDGTSALMFGETEAA